MRLFLIILLTCPACVEAAGACSGIDVGSSLYGHASWNGFVAGSATSTFRKDITASSVDPKSAEWLGMLITTNHGSVYPANGVHTTDIDFLGTAWEGFQVHYVHGNSQRRMVIRDNPAGRESYPADSDPGTFPVPNKVRIQNLYGPFSRPWDGVLLDQYAPSDQHLFVVDVDNCIGYEAYGCYDDDSNISCASYSAYYLAGGDLQRPYNLTGGASVSGMPMLFGMLRYDEFSAGMIPHALGITVLPGQTTTAFTGAASHAQCCGAWAQSNIPFGAKLRLHSNFDASGFPDSCAPIFAEMKQYGLIVYDGGATADILTQTDYNWPVDCPIAMRTSALVNADNFDVITTTGTYCVAGTSGCPDNQPVGSPPQISSFTATPTVITIGQSTMLSWSVSGVVDVDGNDIPLRNISFGPQNKLGPGWLDGSANGESISMIPVQPGTYTYQLMVQNRFGRATKTVSVTVNVSYGTIRGGFSRGGSVQ